MGSASLSVSAWRTAFLTLRDETLTSPLCASLPALLQHHIFSEYHTLVSAVSDLPPHEVSCDTMFLLKLVGTASKGGIEWANAVISACHMIYEICQRTSMEITLPSWVLVLGYLKNMVQLFLVKDDITTIHLLNRAGIRAIKEILDIVRILIDTHNRNCHLEENIQSVKFLLSTFACLHMLLNSSSCSKGSRDCSLDSEKRFNSYCSLWEIQTSVLTMTGEVLSRVGSSLPVDIWRSAIEVLKNVMDIISSKGSLVEDKLMSNFYTSVLHCLHLVLTNPKDSILDHVPGFVAALQPFLTYGVTIKTQLVCLIPNYKANKLNSKDDKLKLEEPGITDSGLYRPPHIRNKNKANVKQHKSGQSQCSSDEMSSAVDLARDSDHSDSDGGTKDTDYLRSSKARIAALNCIQDLCRADPKLFSAQWALLLPTNNIFQFRKHEAALMTCLIFDPSLKARIACASTLASMLDGPSSVLLQVAEFKESMKCGSFTALSSSLGQMLMQLYTGILHLVKSEAHGRLLAALFKVLMLLIKSTPYPRMPKDLLPTVISTLQESIEDGFPSMNDSSALMALAFSCLTVALSISPGSVDVKEELYKRISISDFSEPQGHGSVLLTIFRYSEHISDAMICFEALQALKAVSHNYPNAIDACWGRISGMVYELLCSSVPEISAKALKGYMGNSVGSPCDKVIAAAVKVLDECLRAISGFKGTEEASNDQTLETPFTSDCMRIKKISSAPLDGIESVNGATPVFSSESLHWCEVMGKHFPLAFRHNSAMVRAASVTCLAGITSSAFFSLTTEKQSLIVTSLANAALRDAGSPVRSAACRGIGVVVCFPKVSDSLEVLREFSHAAEFNTRDPSALVRTTASWAVANICDSLRNCKSALFSEGGKSCPVALLAECALRLTKDVDKIKSNAVRALGNLSRCIGHESISSPYDKPLRWEEDMCFLERMVQAFLSCITTGNVKVQWNVCHALSNLFQNGYLKLQDLEWAPSVFSVLLLLLRDSSNFKIRIQSAAALAVPKSIHDYGRSYSDILQGLQHIVEDTGSDPAPEPSDYKYRAMLRKQLTSTMLHLLALASGCKDQPLKDFLLKKSSFFESWFKVLLSLLEDSAGVDTEADVNIRNQKEQMIRRAMQSLAEVYDGSNQHAAAQRFKNLVRHI